MANFRHGTFRVLTANDLLTGDVVFLTAQGSWSRDLDEACLAGTPQEAANLETKATSAEVEAVTAAAYTIDVARKPDRRFCPVRRRENIRVTGPLVEQLPKPVLVKTTQIQAVVPGMSVPPATQSQSWHRPVNGDDHVSL